MNRDQKKRTLSLFLALGIILVVTSVVRAEDTGIEGDRFTLEPEFTLDSGDYGGGDTITTHAFSVTAEYAFLESWTLSLTIVPYLHQDETFTDVVLVAGKPVHHFDTSGANPHHGDTHVHTGHETGNSRHDSGHTDSHGTLHHDDRDSMHSSVHQHSGQYVQSGGSPNVAAAAGAPVSGQGLAAQASAGDQVEREIRRHGSATGIGDTFVDVSYRIIEETEAMPEMSVHAGVKFPTADEDKGLGTGEFDYQTGVAINKEVGRWSLEGGVDYNILGEPDDYDLDNYVSGYGEVATEVLPNTEVAMQLFGAQAASEESKGELALGMKLRYDMEQVGEFSAGLQKGLADGSPDYSVVVGYSISF
jgi:hypothetical protein